MTRIAYFFNVFPAISTTFLQRELRALAELDVRPVLASIHPSPQGELHPQDDHFLGETFYLSPVKPWRFLWKNFKAMITTPGRYYQGLKLALSMTDDFPWSRIRNLTHLAAAAVLADHFHGLEVGHVHVHFAFGAAGMAIFLEVLSGISYSLSIHGSDVLLPNPLIAEKLKQARFIVSNCHFHLVNLRRQHPSLADKRFYVIRLGLDRNSAPWNQVQAMTIELPLRVLNVARLHPVKAQEVLIKACAILRDQGVPLVCRLVGDGPQRQVLTALISELSLGDQVELMGTRYEQEVAALYDWCQVMVLSSKSEGTPMTIIEAMTKARPVIAPRITALPDMIQDGVNGFLFTPGSAEELAAKLKQISENLELGRRMGLAGRELSAERYDLSGNARRLKSVFARELPVLGWEVKEEVDYE